MSKKFQTWEDKIKKAIWKELKKINPETSLLASDLMLEKPPSREHGDFAVGCFRLAQKGKNTPPEVAKHLSEKLKSKEIQSAQCVGPYLNIKINRTEFFKLVVETALKEGDRFGPSATANPKKIMVEYSSPNTNKPMHLGHVRNNTLGVALGNLLKACGHEVLSVNLVNDRGIHICKSMVAYQKWGKGKTPSSEGIKGDHFVGQYYVRFDQEMKKEKEIFFNQNKLSFESPSLGDEEWKKLLLQEKLLEEKKMESLFALRSPEKNLDKVFKEEKSIDKEIYKKLLDCKKREEKKRQALMDQREEEFEKQCSLLQAASSMLKEWEEGNPEIRKLWETMNSWVYEGFQETYRRLGCAFDIWNYESQTYSLGKKVVADNLGKGVFYQKEDGSVWAKLEGKRNGFPLQDKVVLRSDGTSVYITQDLGTALERFEKYHPDRMIYVVASEQNLHFATLFEILSRLGYTWANKCFHAAYGMVTLPEGRGKLKSREGTAVDADALLDEVKEKSRQIMEENKFCNEEQERDANAEIVAIGTLKFLILHVTLNKDLQFDPEQDIQLTGDSGPALQYSYPRIRSIYRNASEELKKAVDQEKIDYTVLEQQEEWDLALQIYDFPAQVAKAGENYAPAFLANYLLDLSKVYARFFEKCHVLKAPTRELQKARLRLCLATGSTLKRGLEILGIPVPEKM